MTDAPRRITLTRAVMFRLLDAVDACVDAPASTFYLPSGGSWAPPPDAPDVAAAFVEQSATGAVVFWGEPARLAIAPPFPLDAGEYPCYHTQPLRESLTRERRLGIVLVRLGGYSVGVYEHGQFVDTKTGGRFVKNRHRKGGQSQRRFERIREGQIREHYDDVAEVIRARLLPVVDGLDWVVLGGDRHTIQGLLKRAPLPPPLEAKRLPRVLDVPEPRRDVLERSPAAIWSSRVLILRDPSSDAPERGADALRDEDDPAGRTG